MSRKLLLKLSKLISVQNRKNNTVIAGIIIIIIPVLFPPNSPVNT